LQRLKDNIKEISKYNLTDLLTKHYFMKKLAGLLWIILCPLALTAQDYTLSWEGIKLVPDTEFFNTSNWNCNQSSLQEGDSCFVSSDTALHLHWIFGAGSRGKFSQCYHHLTIPLDLSDKQVIGIDIHGKQGNSWVRNVELKFESGSKQASYTWENLAHLNRWGEKLVVLKKQLSNYQSVKWDSITVISLAVTMNSADLSDNEIDSGTVSFRNLMAASVDGFIRAGEAEYLTDFSTGDLENISLNAAQAIKVRQNPNGLITTWIQAGSSWLYGQGLALRVLTEEGEWNGSAASNDYAIAAAKLARFLATNQSAEGYWPRAWDASTGNIIVPLEGDNTVWMGDFPWIPGSLANYYRKSGDTEVLPSIIKAKTFLYDLIEATGKVNTVQIITRQKYEVSNYEGYAAVLYCLLELGDTLKAKLVLDYLMNTGWDDQLRMWNEGPGSSRPVLLVNTWLAAIASSMGYEQQSLDALSLVGKLLYTRGPGVPYGFDGVGPIATWYEGTLSYIASAGPGSNALFAGIKDHINADGSVPAYNENLGSMAGIWAVDWSSLDATSWLYFAAAQKVPFGFTGADPDLFTELGEKEAENPGIDIRYGHSKFYIIDNQYYTTEQYKLELFAMNGVLLGTCSNDNTNRVVRIQELTREALTQGNLYLVVLSKGNLRCARKFTFYF
jgi:hypothetical protein